MKRTHMLALGLLLICCSATGLLLLNAGGAPAPAPEVAPSTPAAVSNLTVHEWGTFTSFSGSNGTLLNFYPRGDVLPRFVYSPYQLTKSQIHYLVSMETPVIYFYTDRPMTVTAEVKFPKGRLTEWYPQGDEHVYRGMRWANIKLQPGANLKLPREKEDNHYYAARETDAVPLEMKQPNNKTECEKFIFYRGAGHFQPPLAVRALGEGKFVVKNNGKLRINAFILVSNRGGKLRFQEYGYLEGGAEQAAQEPKAESSLDKLGETVARLLTEEGLYEKEAKAMVKTWRPSWFGEDGTRVLYLVPEATTDELLPLRIEPKPDAIVRVMVGRHDVLTPEREQEIDGMLKKVRSAGSQAEYDAGWKEIGKLGRFEAPARDEAMRRLAKKQ